MRFLCVGGATQDVFLSESEAFEPVRENSQWFEKLELGEKFDVNKIDFNTGGGATNAAVTFARQGHESVFLGSVGNDPAGEMVLRSLNGEKVDTGNVTTNDKYNTGYSVLLLAPNGERTILTYRGASTHYDKRFFSLNGIEADWLYVTALGGKMDILEQLFWEAKSKGMKIAFNPGKNELRQPKLLKKLLTRTDVLLTNKEEMSQIVKGDTIEELVVAATKLVPVAVVTDSSNGAAASDGKVIVRAGLYAPDQVTVDRTGAGDSFGSGFVVRVAEGAELADAVHFGSANAANVCMAIGAKTNILRDDAKLHKMSIESHQLS